jgi:WD40 repeat protein
VFLDDEESRGGALGQALAAALLASGKLLVICSPRARLSRWVNLEITTFLSQKSGADIVTVLAEGLPNNEATTQGLADEAAFPLALTTALQDEPWPADFRDATVGRKLKRIRPGWFQLLSAIYGVSRERIEQREKRRTRTRLGLVVFALLLLLLGGIRFYQERLAKNQETAAKNKETLAKNQEILRKESLVLVDEMNQLTKKETLPKRAELAMQAASKARTPQAIAALRATLDEVLTHDAAICRPGNSLYPDSVVTVSPKKTKLAIGTPKGSIEIIDLSTFQSVPLSGHIEPVTLLQFDPQEKWLLSYSKEDYQLCAWDVQSGVRQSALRWETYRSDLKPHFTPTGDAVVLSWWGKKSELRKLPLGELISTLENASSEGEILFSPDGKMFASYPISAFGGSNFQLYETLSGRLLWNSSNRKASGEESHDVEFSDLAFSKDGTVLTALMKVFLDPYAKFARLDLRQAAEAFHWEFISAEQFDDVRLANGDYTSLSGTIADKIIARYPKLVDKYGLRAVLPSPNGKYVLAWAEKAPARAFATSDGALLFDTAFNNPEPARFSPDGDHFCLFGSSYDEKKNEFTGGRIEMWSASERKRLWQRTWPHAITIGAATFTADGKQFVVYNSRLSKSQGIVQTEGNEDSVVHFFNAQTGADITTIRNPAREVELIDTSNRLVVCRNGHEVSVYAAADGSLKKSFNLFEKDRELLQQDERIANDAASIESVVEILAKRCHLAPIQPAPQ